jgi:AbiU2
MSQDANSSDGAKERPASVVYEISDAGFTDGIEIKQLVQLLEIQNNEGVNNALNLAEADTAGLVLRNSMITRLVLLVSRVYALSREHDMHVGRAFDLLDENPAVKADMAGRGPPGSLNRALETWRSLRGDHRLPKIKQFRDKYTAHLGKPKPEISLPEFRELFSFAHDTTQLLDQLARATGARREGLNTWDNQLQDSARKFWKPWMTAGD